MNLPWGKIAIGAGIVIVAIAALAVGMSWLRPSARPPALAEVRPLAPVARSSTIIAPVYIAQIAIRDALERKAPRELSGKPQLPSLPFLSDAEIGWSVARGPFSVAGR